MLDDIDDNDSKPTVASLQREIYSLRKMLVGVAITKYGLRTEDLVATHGEKPKNTSVTSAIVKAVERVGLEISNGTVNRQLRIISALHRRKVSKDEK